MAENVKCRSCNNKNLTVFLDLGEKPPSDRILTEDMLGQKEKFYPLEVAFCPHCSLVQILETLPSEDLFTDGYEYYSSFIPALLEHARNNVNEMISSRQLGPNHLVMEIASNDGYLLPGYPLGGQDKDDRGNAFLKQFNVVRKLTTGLVPGQGVDLHSFRHTFETTAANHGVDQRVINEITGHANDHGTGQRVYLHGIEFDRCYEILKKLSFGPSVDLLIKDCLALQLTS